MNIATNAPLRWDPYDREIAANPYPTYRRLREESPIYYNEEYDFYAVSRYEDVQNGLADRDTFISGKGGILEIIKSNMPIPPGVFIFEDPPLHTIHRGVLTRVFTPKKMAALEPQIREFCARALDPLVGTGRFDFVKDLGSQMPMRVIGMLLGIPDEDLESVRERADANLRTEAGKPMDYSSGHDFRGEGFEEYLDWRAKHPSDDLMTELLDVEFTDETGTLRKLTRDEILIFINILAGAGNETTNRLIGWTGKVLGEHPDQRRQIAADRSLINQTIEEILRYEPPGPFIGRYVTRAVDYHGRTVPKDSVIMFLVSSGNRDDRKFANGDSFDIHRERLPHLSFGHGFHSCLGNALARVEGRIALDEVLKRFPDWEPDLANAELSCTSTVRGWETMPTYTDGTKPAPRKAKAEEDTSVAPGSAGGTWKITLSTPMGPQEMTATLKTEGDRFTGRVDSAMGGEDISGKIAGDTLSWTMDVTKPMKIKLSFEVKVAGNKMTGSAKLGMFGKAAINGERV